MVLEPDPSMILCLSIVSEPDPSMILCLSVLSLAGEEGWLEQGDGCVIPILVDISMLL